MDVFVEFLVNTLARPLLGAVRPFPRPESGKVAVKVVNHYGDEVLKVYEVGR